jgi:hypothetical protein
MNIFFILYLMLVYAAMLSYFSIQAYRFWKKWNDPYFLKVIACYDGLLLIMWTVLMYA